MDRTGASCYVYAKASGMLSKSFTGPRTVNLFNAKSLQELWTLLFTDEVPAVPQALLAEEIEKKASQKFITEYSKLLNCYSKPDEVLVELLHWFDFENLKNAGAVLATGQSKKCDFLKINPFNILDYEKWPDISKLTADSELSWYNHVPDISELEEYSNKLDVQFIKKIWKSTEKLPADEKEVVQNIISDRYSKKNILWAMRLKVYYNMSAEEIKKRLVYFDDSESKADLFAGEALKILNFKTDVYDEWSSWKYASLINDVEDSKFWMLNPQVVEEKISKEYYRSMKRSFHRYPFTSMVLVTWFFIKQHELDCIRTATEAIRLNVDEEQMRKIAGEI